MINGVRHLRLIDDHLKVVLDQVDEHEERVEQDNRAVANRCREISKYWCQHTQDHGEEENSLEVVKRLAA